METQEPWITAEKEAMNLFGDVTFKIVVESEDPYLASHEELAAIINLKTERVEIKSEPDGTQRISFFTDEGDGHVTA